MFYMGGFDQFRDQNVRGKNCNCSQKWFNQHNNSPEMVKQTKKLGKEIGKFNLKDYCLPTFNEKGEYWDRSLNKFVNWEEYKRKFEIQNINFKLPECFINIPTFRTQESENWIGSKTAFEQSLIDLNVW